MHAFEVDEDRYQHGEDVPEHRPADIKDQSKGYMEFLDEIAEADHNEDVD
jgi:hypothetical protein